MQKTGLTNKSWIWPRKLGMVWTLGDGNPWISPMNVPLPSTVTVLPKVSPTIGDWGWLVTSLMLMSKSRYNQNVNRKVWLFPIKYGMYEQIPVYLPSNPSNETEYVPMLFVISTCQEALKWSVAHASPWCLAAWQQEQVDLWEIQLNIETIREPQFHEHVLGFLNWLNCFWTW